MKKQNFSLIELLIVIGILGALVSLVLPGFSDTADHAKDKAAATEMREIQESFRRFAEDTRLKNSNDDMYDIICYGLWPLTNETHPLGVDDAPVTYSEYDSSTGTGRRGPYLRREDEKSIATSPTNVGQVYDEGGTVTIPVIKDPYGGYYRVMCPEITGSEIDTERQKKYRKMVLICTGPDCDLDTSASNVDDDTGEIEAQSDDIVIRLMPLATY